MEGLIVLTVITLVMINLVCWCYICKNILKFMLRVFEVRDILNSISNEE